MKDHLDLNQTQMYHRTGISQSTISRMINGEYNLESRNGIQYLEKILAVVKEDLGVSITVKQLMTLPYPDLDALLRKKDTARKVVPIPPSGCSVRILMMLGGVGVVVWLILWATGVFPFAPGEKKPEVEPILLVAGTFTNLMDGDTVHHKIDVSGTVERFSAALHLWLVVEVNDTSGTRYWPKKGEIIPESDGTWKKQIYQDSFTEKEVNLGLWVVSDTLSTHILQWLEEGDRTGDYPSFDLMRTGRRLFRVDNLSVALN